MTIKRRKKLKGISLIEVLIAIVILAVAILGTASFRYHATFDANKAGKQITAARTALMLCESWRGLQGSKIFDPVDSFNTVMTISLNDEDDGSVPADFTLLGTYDITLDSINYYATMSWKEISSGLRALNVNISWRQHHIVSDEDDFDNVDKSFELTTYALSAD